MTLIVVLLLAVKLVCLTLDSEHELFRPISMYQTADYYYLGNLFVALLVLASFLMLRRQFARVESSFQNGNVQATESNIPTILGMLSLTILLFVLFLAPIQFGHFHIFIAVSSMIGYTLYLHSVSRLTGDTPMRIAALIAAMVCAMPVFWPQVFGFAEHCLLVLLLTGFVRQYKDCYWRFD